ncbi:hypothetical protein [Sulfurisoma sediminicola]|uniref:Uncharacterized protein n=1 Tax=Sulfurisoma sediminicola TaxID=1381557 RepID=A0A497X8W0_9PROT|nr:hypothetical protein [Sulfurisoma sediminicola]RLJ62140.1 hypothetical protein DFR35_2783 [Sulfurisoma sediminicola]
MNAISRKPIRWLLAAAAAATCWAQAADAPVEGQDAAVAKPAQASPAPEPRRWLVQFKRQATDRGTDDESTRTQVRFEHFPDGLVNLWRLDLPFPDEKTDFAGDLFNPRPGDIKVRMGMKAVPVAGRPVSSFIEATLPTASPESLGSGKYQLGVGVRTRVPLALGTAATPVKQSFSAQVQQVVSVAGDDARKDINQTKFELEVRGEWPQARFLKFTAKPVIDWVQNARTGAVGELEGGWRVGRDWELALLGGALLWGKGVPSTYGKRAEFKASYRF